MERIEVNVQTGEVKTIQLTQEEIDAIVAAQPTPSEQPIEPIAE
jgi:hypothetical protein